MKDAYRIAELRQAEHELASWRKVYNEQPMFNHTKREAAEKIEFWSNRVAFLSCASADDAEPFTLRNEPARRGPAKFETVKGRQRDLFVGLSDLPGQMLLIDEVNTD